VRRIAGITLAAAAAVVTISSSSAAGADGPARTDIESASSAIPVAPGTTAQDESIRYRRVNAHTVRADSAATATSSCDGCTASTVTLQFIYARGSRTLTANNVAVAWSSCTNCSATALSVQVVIAHQAGKITAGNRSLSLNVACAGCNSNAAAIQIVIVTASHREPSQAALARSEDLRAQLLAELHALPLSHARTAVPATPNGRAAPTPAPVPAPPSMVNTTEQIQSILARDLGATSARHDIQLRTQ
jgi:hypothetical protein